MIISKNKIENLHKRILVLEVENKEIKILLSKEHSNTLLSLSKFQKQIVDIFDNLLEEYKKATIDEISKIIAKK